MRIASIVNDSIVDGQGLRLAVFVQGCSHKCKGCHNPQSHDPKGGHEESIEEIISKIRNSKLIDGITLTGGEPFDQSLLCAKIAIASKKLGYNVWTYTGYTYEQLRKANRADYDLLLANTDVLVDGPFVEELKSYELHFRGSKNQRLIDVKKTLTSDEIVEYKEDKNILDKFQVPES